jgi:plasmid stability protein
MAILHIRSVPDDLYARLRARAQTERRSLSAEVLLLLERAVMLPEWHDDPASVEYARRKQTLVEQAERWYQVRNKPISQEEEAAAWAQIDGHREAMREKYGEFPDSLSLLHAARAERERDP